MREFAIYTGLRLALFVAAFAVVFGLWLLIADEAALLWPLLIAMLISGVASVYLLRAPANGSLSVSRSGPSALPQSSRSTAPKRILTSDQSSPGRAIVPE